MLIAYNLLNENQHNLEQSTVYATAPILQA